MNYKTCWLTLNRACNLRCKWCYARNTGYKVADDIDYSLACQIIDLCSDLKIKHITLIGGEPTIYPNLFDVIDYCHNKKISCGFVTNGLACKDKNFVNNLRKHMIKGVSISLKGETAAVFKDVTGVDAFEDVLLGIRNCLSSGLSVTVSMVLTEENINSYLVGVKTLKELGVKNFHFSFCYEFDTSMEHNHYLKQHNPKKLIKEFVSSYSELDKITNHCFTLQESFPLCLWDKDILEKLNQKGQISTVCQLLAKTGLLFDTMGNIIPCNAMADIKLGQLNVDFKTAQELIKHTQQEDFKKIYSKLCGVPDLKCLECCDLPNCGGGCVCQWTNYNYKQLMEMKDE